MKNKLLAGLLLATLAIGTLSPTTVTAATTKTTTATTKEETTTKVDGVKINDLLTGKYNKIISVNQKRERETVNYLGTKYEKKKIFFTDYAINRTITHYKTDGIYFTGNGIIYQRTFGKDYQDKNTDKYSEYDDTPSIIRDKPTYKYNSDNFIPAGTNGSLYDWYGQVESRKKEIAKWRLDPSCFKTTKTKLTDDEIIIKGTYTFSVQKLYDGVYDYTQAEQLFHDYSFDADFYDGVMRIFTTNKTFKNVKCDATVVFYRDTKQIKSLELKAKLPKDGYAMNDYGTEVTNIYNVSYTFEHQLTKEQKASRAAKVAIEDLLSGKVNKFKSIEVDDYWNFNDILGMRYDYDYHITGGLDISRVGTDIFWFDYSRFTVTSSKPNSDGTIVVTGTYSIDIDANTFFDKRAAEQLIGYGFTGNLNSAKVNVTILSDYTKELKKVTLKYDLSGVDDLYNEYGKKWDQSRIAITQIFTFK